jgi:hypothetical protein
MSATATLGFLIEVYGTRDMPGPLLRILDTPLSMKTKYRAAKLVQVVESELRIFEAERQSLFKTFGTERPATPEERPRFGSTVVEVPPDRIEAFQAQLQELALIEVTLDWAPLQSTELPEVSARDWLALGPLCELVAPGD